MIKGRVNDIIKALYMPILVNTFLNYGKSLKPTISSFVIIYFFACYKLCKLFKYKNGGF